LKASDLITRFEKFAPTDLAEPKDPVGLQLGSINREIQKVMVTLDVRPEVVAEAVANNVDFIFSHHPMMFRPAQNLDLSVPQNQMYADLIKHDITVYSAHTNLDNVAGGMNDWLSQLINLHHTSGLVFRKIEPDYLLSVQVPSNDIDAVRLALADLGSRDGVSDGSSFQTSGISWFTPMNDEEVALGSVGERTWADEVLLKLRVKKQDLSQAIETMKRVHPSSSPIYNVTELQNGGTTIYMGRIGELSEPVTVSEFAAQCKSIFNVPGLRLVSQHPEKMVRRVAILGGDGGKFYPEAIEKGADVYITGDVYYHTAHDMLAAGLSVIDPGHHIERICKPKLVKLFDRWKIENDWQVDFSESKLNTDPFTFI